MDVQLRNMMRNITGLWIISYIYCLSMFFIKKKTLQEKPFLWHVNGILAVTYSMEVGACICYLWTKHSCPGFILKDDWVNWSSWIIILLFFTLIIIILLKLSYVYFSFFYILMFSLNFVDIDNIIFLMPIFRLYFWRILHDIL